MAYCVKVNVKSLEDGTYGPEFAIMTLHGEAVHMGRVAYTKKGFETPEKARRIGEDTAAKILVSRFGSSVKYRLVT